jgi:hypothetical protein
MIPDRSSHEEGETRPEQARGLLRRALVPNAAAEGRLLALLAERRRELQEHAARFEERIVDLERREELLSDERAAVERLLRRGTAELEARERELVQFERELVEREARLDTLEADVKRRRGELGAVELRRAAVELREKAVDAREAEFAARESELEQRPPDGAPSEEGGPVLLFVPGPRYRLVEHESLVRVGDLLELEGVEYVAVRVGRSPLPGDARPCAYLVRGAPRSVPSDGSS